MRFLDECLVVSMMVLVVIMVLLVSVILYAFSVFGSRFIRAYRTLNLNFIFSFFKYFFVVCKICIK